MAAPVSCSAFRRTALVLALMTGGMPAFAQDAAKRSATQIASSQLAGEVVLIPNRVIYPGETIELAALKQVTLIPGKHKPDAVTTVAEELQGKIAKRTLLPGRYIPAAAIRDAWLVEQGAAVQVFFIAGGLTISATAVTLQPGSAGDLIKVRNSDSGKILSGTVMADGTIQVSAS
ncbi:MULTISPECIES: flagellar basal body P-ring formation chaperone FlgA [unclassified Mesorhizobium]|uniref:flagellar basal body P-ring formation chaperone FlgA n=1 Tax=unclassified Mesorhizobium TaxID=325217 RepID=UPI00112918E5|nr:MULTISPECIES: flagellar basal body P-ring formation chaperone FlgA [unclassified Mesorhizobium]TPI54555.1 flagellar basal body P-ring formation protein FlgA [Mesorhizobium sp. B3-1-1]TPJ69908.1 flagellar basal body P-ring formation protein FlgA [Mesorhizobium sp. B2-6-7]TPJ82066.1 flagellar basal body P-ring formation protein FlgA [Mesorhizobium sp. B2-6-3]TPJ98424.1 flagellar basal body P-ring formation protein FlgA [Mesorhizobium sp. B2-5-10]TPK08520.1 flagellar basal body P-ring formatio